MGKMEKEYACHALLLSVALRKLPDSLKAGVRPWRAEGSKMNAERFQAVLIDRQGTFPACLHEFSLPSGLQEQKKSCACEYPAKIIMDILDRL